MKLTETFFGERINSIIPIKNITNDIFEYTEDINNKEIKFEIETEFTFEIAHKISELLQTDEILIWAGGQSGNHDTCDFYDEHWLIITCKKIQFPQKKGE